MIALIGKKIGMTQVFSEQGSLVPVTVIKIEPNTVLGERTEEKNGYNAVVLGSVNKKKQRVIKPVLGQFPEGVEPKRFVTEIRDFSAEYKLGQELGVDLLADYRFVDVIGTSKGKGFQGAMKRHNFSGGRKTHGSKFHRDLGGTGMAATPSRVLKGKKMAGRMGFERKTVQNLEVVSIDKESNLVLVKGSVPGSKNSFIVIRNAKKR